MKTKVFRPPLSLFIIIVFCSLSLPWTTCHPSSMPSFLHLSSPVIHGEVISFLGETVQHQGMDVAIFLQTDCLLKVVADDDHDSSAVFNSIIYHGHLVETAARSRWILCTDLWPSFGYLVAKADDEGLI